MVLKKSPVNSRQSTADLISKKEFDIYHVELLFGCFCLLSTDY